VKDHEEETAPVKPEPKKGKPAKPRAKGPAVDGGSRDARRLAAAILEVLGGARLPSDAAGALGISLPRYYLLETRALNGLVEACEPKPLGRVRSPESELAAVQNDLERLKRENARLSALVRVAQRTIGLAAPPPPKPSADGKKKRKRKPTVRALRAVKHLLRDDVSDGVSAVAGEASTAELQAVAVS
jgi:hypothetical protein